MRVFFSFVLILCACLNSTANEHQLNKWFMEVDAFLQEQVEDGLVDYKMIRDNPMELMQLIRTIQEVDISQHDEATQKAFWINAYNILTISGIITEYPVSSPLDIDGFFKANKHKAAGEWLTLDDIENKKLMDMYEDARLHFALVCAARGCPKLYDRAYTPGKLDAQLEKQIRLALNDNDFVRIEDGKVLVSEIFKWYDKDFLKESPDFRSYINKYREQPLPDGLSFGYYTYDWSLNEKKK